MKNWKKIKLVGEKVFLRPLRKTDVKRVFELINDRDVTFFLDSVEAPVTMKQEKKFVTESEQDWQKGALFSFAICEKKSEEVVGGCGLSNYKKEHRRATFGIWLGKKHWSRGFGSEAVFLAFKFGFEKLKLNRIRYSYNMVNKRSASLAKKVGAKIEGCERQVVFKRGKFYDGIVCSMLASEWKKKQSKKRK